MAASSSSALVPSSSISSLGFFKYQVFLSFRGVDTRHGFTWNLYNSLRDAGIETFMDEKDIEAGEKVDERVLKAIGDSRYCVVILSSRCADSKACLMELAAMFRLKKEIIPVFFYIEPSDVSHQSGPFKIDFSAHQKRSFEIAFSTHQNRSNSSRDVEEWRQALTKVGQLKGFHLNHKKKEAEVIQEIVERVGGCVMSPVAEHPVGINSRVEEVMELLSIGEGGVKMVGIYGMGGVGKTTLAKEIRNRLEGRFEKTIYIKGIKDEVKKAGLPKLQQQFISYAFKHGNLVRNISEGLAVIKRRFGHTKLLAILDDVDHRDQLKALAGGCDWFGEGTRILITTRDKHLLDAHRVDGQYEVHELNSRESLHLFSRHAFKTDQPPEEFMEISKKIAAAAGGLPLALEVLGALLSTETKEEAWKEVLTKLRSSGYPEINKCLRISYDGLSPKEQEVFLDIVCFFIGEKKNDVIDIWKGCDFGSPESTIKSLLRKCLVKVDNNGRLYMHNLLRDMGRDIGSRSRLWDQKKVWDVLEGRKETDQIKGVICKGHLEGEENSSDAAHSLVPPEKEKESVDVEAFANMSNLQFLLLENTNLKGDFSKMPRSLRSLKWTGCFMQMLPDNFNIQKLGCLKLDSSKIVQFWSDSYISKEKVFTNLKVLDLRDCSALKELPDFSHFLSLEKLCLGGCNRLTDIPESIGNSTKLKMIDLIDCDALQSLPSSIGRLSKLEDLVLRSCSSLSRLPDSFKKLTGLRDLEVSHCASLLGLPNSIENFTRLEELSLRSWASFSTLPYFVENLTRLRSLDLSNCERLSALPKSIENLSKLEELRLDYCKSLSTLPNSIGKLTRLERLMLNSCKSLSVLPGSIGNLTELEELVLLDCTSLPTFPDSIGNLTRLKDLDVRGCKSLLTLPDSIGKLTGLSKLDLFGCDSLLALPDSIGKLAGLSKLDLLGCDSLLALPNSIGSLTRLEELRVSSTRLSTLPPSIENLTRLGSLEVYNCERLLALPYSIRKLTLLEELQLGSCTSLSTLPDSIGNLTGLSKLDLLGCNSLLALPDSIGSLTRLEELRVSSTRLSTLPPSIGNLIGLRWLDLSYCESLSALPDSIEYLTGLRKLDVYSCKSLLELSNSIRRLTLLEELRLGSCTSLSTLPHFVENLTRLRSLDLSDCECLSALPDSIENLSELQVLRLDFCKSLSTLPNSLGKLTRLMRLMLNFCKSLSALPDSIGNLIELEELVLRECTALPTLPDSIGSLTKLRRLDLSYCESLSALPDSIGRLTLLEELQLGSCTSLSTLPHSIGNLARLGRLHVFKCGCLSALPDSLGRLTALQEVILTECRSLSMLPNSIGYLTRLKSLTLCDCKSLSALPDSIENLIGLRILKVAGCKSLSTLPDSIGNLTGLEELNLTSCKSLSTLPSSIGSMRKLSTLVLSKSGIEELPDSVRMLESLEWLGIVDCRLRSRLPLWELKRLKGLVIGGEFIEKDESDSDNVDENEICEISDGFSDNDDGGQMEVCEIPDGIAGVGGEVNQKDESDSEDGDPMEVCEISNDITQKDESDGDDGDQNNEVCEIPVGITHYSQHTKECRRIRYIESWDDPFHGSEAFELSIWAESGRERKIILVVYPWSWKCKWSLKPIFPDDFTPLHDTEKFEACASSSSAPNIFEKQLDDFYAQIDYLRGYY